MKKILLATAVLLSVTAAPAVADETSDMLEQTILRLQAKVDDQDAKIERKNTLLACERDARRTVARAMRSGDVVEVPRCR